MPAKSAGSEDKCSDHPRGSVLQQNVTKLAPVPPTPLLSKRKIQHGEAPLCGSGRRPRQSLPQPPKTTDPAADGRSPHQWRPIQVQYWLEVQNVQHNIQPGTVSRPWTKAESFLPDCNAGADEGTHSKHLPGHAQSQQDLRRGVGAILPDAGAEVRAQKEAPSSTEEACQTSDTIEETITSTDEAVAQRKRARFYKGSSPCPIIHTRPSTSTSPPSDPTTAPLLARCTTSASPFIGRFSTASGSTQTTVVNLVSPRR